MHFEIKCINWNHIVYSVKEIYWKNRLRSFKYQQWSSNDVIKVRNMWQKNSRFIKNQEAKGLLSNLGIRTPLSKVPILGDILF